MVRAACCADWVSAQGSSGGNRAFGGAPGTRRALAWYPQAGTDTNVTVIITNVVRSFLPTHAPGKSQAASLVVPLST